MAKDMVPPKPPSKNSGFTDAMKSHGVAKGPNKRHPSTGHLSMGPQGNRFGRKP